MGKTKNSTVEKGTPKKTLTDGGVKETPPPPGKAIPKQRPPAAIPGSSSKQTEAQEKARRVSQPRREPSDQIQVEETAEKNPGDGAGPPTEGPEAAPEKGDDGALEEGVKKRKRGPAKKKMAGKKPRLQKAVDENRGPPNEQTRARVKAMKNQCQFRSWEAEVGDLRVKLGDRVLYKSAKLTHPKNESPSLTLYEGSLVQLFGVAAAQRVWALGHATNGTRLPLFVGAEDPASETAPRRTSIFEVTKILPGEPLRPAGADKWLADEAERTRQRKQGQKMAMAASRLAQRLPHSGQLFGSSASSQHGLSAEVERLRNELTAERQTTRELRARLDEIQEGRLKDMRDALDKIIAASRQH